MEYYVYEINQNGRFNRCYICKDLEEAKKRARKFLKDLNKDPCDTAIQKFKVYDDSFQELYSTDWSEEKRYLLIETRKLRGETLRDQMYFINLDDALFYFYLDQDDVIFKSIPTFYIIDLSTHKLIKTYKEGIVYDR